MRSISLAHVSPWDRSGNQSKTPRRIRFRRAFGHEPGGRSLAASRPADLSTLLDGLRVQPRSLRTCVQSRYAASHDPVIAIGLEAGQIWPYAWTGADTGTVNVNRPCQRSRDSRTDQQLREGQPAVSDPKQNSHDTVALRVQLKSTKNQGLMCLGWIWSEVPFHD